MLPPHTKKILVAFVLSVLLFVATVTASDSAALSSCISKCRKEDVDHQELCRTSCKHRMSLPNLEVFVDGERLGPSSEESTLSENSFQVNNVNFDRNFYNTPGAFSDILEFKGELMNQFYHQAAAKFNTPGHQYHHGTMLHMLNVPIPLTDAQFNNQEFMNKLVDVVPRSESEYKPVSPLPFSDAYREFLLSVKVDPQNVQDAPSNPDVKAHIASKEQHMENVLNEYMAHAEKCFNDYYAHIDANQLSPISYTLEEYSNHNNECKVSNEKLAEHERLSKELSDFLQNLNPYNELFSAIARTSIDKYNWNYARPEIEQFTNHHRHMESQGIVPADSKYEIPVTIKRNFFNHNYFGQAATHSESNIDAHLSFSGMGWKENPVTPDSWFNLRAVHLYMHHQQTHGKNFFSENGLLNRVPTYLLIAYKPVLKVKISRQMKEGFSDIASKYQLRPLETGCFCYTRVEIVTNNGGKLNEEYEMIMSSTIDHPQIIAFKSTPIVHLPAPGAPALPEYFKFVDKRVVIRSVHNTYIKVEHGGDQSPVVSQAHLDGHAAFFIKNAGENKVLIETAIGNRLRCHPGSQLDGSVHLGDWEKFLLLKEGDKWYIKSVHGTYLRSNPGDRSVADCSPHRGDWEKFTIDYIPDSYQFLERRIALRSVHGTYVTFTSENDYEPLVAQRELVHQAVYTVKNAGDNRVFLENALGTRLRCHAGGDGSRADGSVHLGDWEKFEMIPVDGRWALKSVHGTFIRPHGGDRGHVDCAGGLGDWEKIFVDVVPWHFVYIDRLVGIKSVHNSYLRALEDGEGKNIVTQGPLNRDEKWYIKNAGNNKVYIMNSYGFYMRCHPGDRADTSPHLGGWEQFDLVAHGDKWFIKSAHGTYIRAHPNVGSLVDCSPHMGDWEKFSIEPQPMPLHFKFLNRIVGLKTAHNKYVIANQGEGARASQTPGLNDWEKFRVVYTGHETVAFLSHHGTYLRGPPDVNNQHCKRSWFRKKCWTEHIPSRAITASGIDNCTKFYIVPAEGGKVAFKTLCEGRYLQALDNNELGLQTFVGGWEMFDIIVVR